MGSPARGQPSGAQNRPHLQVPRGPSVAGALHQNVMHQQVVPRTIRQQDPAVAGTHDVPIGRYQGSSISSVIGFPSLSM